ncbi:LysR family transcriptional regulator [Pigmentiphaga soli]|uniref:LysR family transcriptional regulator n=1 Tax=Pigmentiphaga soli TaxID=1007095 RepID=A0ABP8GHD4_9BURK
MRHITLRQIEGFIAAAEALSFARAAESLHVTPPAFSQLIGELEAGLGVRLFDRTTRRVILTTAGESLLRKMKRGLFEIDQACEDAKAIARLERGHLTVSTLPSLAVGIVTQSLGEMRTRFPGLTVSLYEDHNGSLLDRLAQGEDDFAICAYSEGTRDLDFDDLFVEELVAVLPESHPLARRRILSWTSLESEALILTALQSSIREQVRHALRHNRIDKRNEYETANMFTALAMVRAGFGMTIVPLTVLPEVNMAGLAWRRLRNPTPRRRIVIGRRRDRTASPAAQRFEALLRERIEATGIGARAAAR